MAHGLLVFMVDRIFFLMICEKRKNESGRQETWRLNGQRDEKLGQNYLHTEENES